MVLTKPNIASTHTQVCVFEQTINALNICVCTYAPFVIQAEKPTSVSLQSQNYLYPVRVDVGGAKTCQNHIFNKHFPCMVFI